MSRVGRVPIPIPSGVAFRHNGGNCVEVQGPRGRLMRTLHPRVIVEQHGETIEVKRASDSKLDKSLHGLSRTLINNMVVGVTRGFEKQLEIV